MSAQLISIALVALGGLVFSLIFAFISAKGLLPLWIVAGCLALITFIGWLRIEYLTFYEHWGDFGGYGYGVSLLSVSIAILAGAGVFSVLVEERKRVWLKIIIASLVIGLVMCTGLTIWVS